MKDERIGGDWFGYGWWIRGEMKESWWNIGITWRLEFIFKKKYQNNIYEYVRTIYYIMEVKEIPFQLLLDVRYSQSII